MRLILLILLGLAAMPAVRAYSVLTHEAIIDTAWIDSIQPLLKKRFPNATAEDLRKAHAYAYGGAIIQDLGYYPFGSKLFSDLVHYVRAGDFIRNLIRDASDLDEYAFAIGALAHAAADNEGHPIATNRAVADLYPKLRAKFGNNITYFDDPAAHLKVEFGFDVSQVARGNYAPEAYHDFIGFEVAKPLLERAFREIYGIELGKVFFSEDLALGTYRHTVASIIPEMSKVAWQYKKNEIEKARPGTTRRKFVYNLSRASYRKEWGRQYERPGMGARVLAFFFRLVPKVGPFRSLAFRPLTPQTEKLFVQSFDATLDRYRALLRQAASRVPDIPNTNFDTGKPVTPGEYQLTDETYAKLVHKLAQQHNDGVDDALRANILAYYTNPVVPAETPELREELQQLSAAARP